MNQRINPTINKKIILLLWIVAIVLTWDAQVFAQRYSEAYTYDDDYDGGQSNWLIWLWFLVGSFIGIYNWKTMDDASKVGTWLFAFAPLLIIIVGYVIG